MLQSNDDIASGNISLPNGRSATKRRSLGRKPVVILLLIVMFGWQILFRPQPKPVLYFIANHFGGWLINQGPGNYSGARGFAKRLANLWIEQSVMTQMHDRLPPRSNSDDLAILQQRLLQIHPMLINQIDLPHDEILSSNALTGVGKCGGMNLAAAQLLAHDFDQVEMIAIDGDTPDSGHSFGRLWSVQYKDWLYFDIWTAQIQIFTASSRGATYLWRYPAQLSSVHQFFASRTGPMHDFGQHGHIRLKLQKSFGGYIWYRVRNLIDHGTTWEKEMPFRNQPLVVATEPKLLPDAVYKKANNQSAQAATYLTARLDHLFGDKAAAKRGYLRAKSAEQAPDTTVAAASKIFAQRLSKPPLAH